MKTKATKNTTPSPPTYPKLMETNDGTVVLLTERSTGTVVHVGKTAPASCKLGRYSGAWAQQNFTDYDGVVTLEYG